MKATLLAVHLALVSGLAAASASAIVPAVGVARDARIIFTSGATNPARSGAPVIVGDLSIAQAWTRATPPGAPVGGAYLAITNTGDMADRLVAASARVAGRVEIHSMSMSNGVMTMAPVAGGLVIEPGTTEVLAPGGNHVMLMGLKEPILAGMPVSVTLEFERAGAVMVEFDAAPMGAVAPPR